MRPTTLRRFGLSTLLACAVGLTGLAQPASAAAPAMAITTDRATATPGSTVTITMTFTNDQSTNTQFVYQSIQPTWNTSQDPGLKYTFKSCTGDAVQCDVSAQSGTVRYNVPVVPGASRTVKLTYAVAADSACGPSRRIEFYSYLYYEYQGGQAKKDGIYPVGTDITCATTPGATASTHK
ncbi:hypothetical protein BLA24_05955 [Streptomyces cinnamoneus]|uniref:DUF11 domain-containing protein n=1 Tax=Streptomyces cinnamoneus TaxID=53446 RepID=A0A2G1XNI0_STRCJ|nr:hypothetical protein [Streptomyces cinnamoneus]PHQ52802.1 hypothetical protein BLA24_05955 [Streptomyces cinnamoneus]PPT11904.1 hypothetical protein CYQ11_02430 [Streptomyces cinnamoneus]